MTLNNQSDNPWKDAKDYNFGKYSVGVLEAKPNDPVKFYTELHHDDSYWGSMGTRAPFKWLAVVLTYLRRHRL